MADCTWRPSRKKYGVAIYNYGGTVKGGLRLHVGETVHMQEEYCIDGTPSWYRGRSLQNRRPKGIFPASYIHTKDCEVDNEGPHETITPVEDWMVKELTYVFKEWWKAWHELYVRKGTCKTFLAIEKRLNELVSKRGKLVSKLLSYEQLNELRQEIATVVDWGARQLGLDLVPRVNGEQLDPDRCSVVELYRNHIQSSENTQTDVPRKKTPSMDSNRSSGELRALRLHHIFVHFRSIQCNIGDECQIFMSVYNAKEGKFISEQFEISLNKNGQPSNTERVNYYYGLFCDLTEDDLERNLFIVAKIYRCGKMLVAKEHKGAARVYKRPFGVGVKKVEEIHKSPAEEEEQTFIRVQSCTDNENHFPDLHESLIKKTTAPLGSSRFGSSMREEKVILGITVGFKLLSGDLQTVKAEHAMLFRKEVTVIPKLSFADLIINPGAIRNDIYLTLASAEFDRGRKKSEKNVEVLVTVYNSEGFIIPNCMRFGCGENPDSSFYSTIYYHDNNPKWNETVKVSLPMELLPRSLVRFDIFHCSTRGKSDKKLYAFAFFRVTDKDNIVIGDGSHDLCLYQCDDPSKIVFKKYKELPFLFDDFNDMRMSVFVSNPSQMAYKKSGRERLTIRTQLCSTKYTQTKDLLGLLQWKINKGRLDSILEQLMKVDGVEVMKFLPDVLDSLFTMLSDKFVHGKEEAKGRSLVPKVFQVLVYVLNLLQDSRFVTFVNVLENYLAETFSSAVVYRDILNCFADRILDYIDGGSFTVSMGLKVLEPLMRFVVKSQELHLRVGIYNHSGQESEFKQHLLGLFNSMGELLSRKNDRLRISQMALLSNLHKVYSPLVKVLSLRELAEMVQQVVTKMPKSKELSEDVQRNKLDFIKETVNSELFQADESRAIILPLCLTQIKYCMIEKSMLPLATSILGDILNNLFLMKQKMCMQQDINTMVLSVFQVILQTVLMLSERTFLTMQSLPETGPVTPSKSAVRKYRMPFRSLSNLSDQDAEHAQEEKTKNLIRAKSEFFVNIWKIDEEDKDLDQQSNHPSEPTMEEFISLKKKSKSSTWHQGFKIGELIACMIEMLRLMDDGHYDNVMKMFPEGPPLKDFLTRVFLTFQELIKPEVYPSHWTVMRLVTNNVIFTAVEYFSNALTKHFLHSEKFDQQLWQHYFNLSVGFITQQSLQLEKYSEAKRQKILERYQDMRVLMGHQIQMYWENLGNNQRHFIPSLVGPFLKVTLVPQRDLRSATLPIFFDMMKCEVRCQKNFDLVENEIMEKLDIFCTSEDLGDLEYKELFKTILLERVQTEPALQENGSQFILSVTRLLERLLDYRQAYDGDDNKDRRMQCTFNILNFYKDNSNRQEMYIRYIKKLYDLQVSANHYVEAGLTLQLYAQLLKWGDDIKQEDMGFRAEPERERKEKLYLQVIDCFDKGKVWEYGIPLCKELAKYYEERLMYRKLSKILRKEAAFFSKILDGVEVPMEGSDQTTFYPRQEPSYFRVAYYGKNFPPFVRNKAFIYRGDECLRLQDIIYQLNQEFPQANIMKTNSPPDDRMKEGETQYIQIGSVKPLPEERPGLRKYPDAPDEIRKFYNSNDVDTFQFVRSFHLPDKDEKNEFKTLCKEKTLMKTNYKFPGILQWYEVISMETQVLSPICTAIEAVSDAVQDLKSVTENCQHSPSNDNVKHLSMLLNGMISANVQGGIPKYQEAFFSNDFAMQHPEESQHIFELKYTIKEQVKLLDKGLKIMKKCGHKELEALTKSLSSVLHDIKTSIEERDPSMISVIKRPDSGMGSQVFEQPRANTPSINSLHSSSSNRSSEYSLENMSAEEGIYTDPVYDHDVNNHINPQRSGSDPSVKDLPSSEGGAEYVHPPSSPNPCKPHSRSQGYVSPATPIPVIPTPARPRRLSESIDDKRETPPPIPRKMSMQPTSHGPLLPNKTPPAVLPKPKNPPSLPPRESVCSPPGLSDLSRSMTNISHSQDRSSPKDKTFSGKIASLSSSPGAAKADYKQIEVVSSHPPPIPARHSQRTTSSATPPKVSPRASQISTSSSSSTESSQL